MKIRFYASTLETKANPYFTSEIIRDKFEVINQLNEFLMLNCNSDDPYTLIVLENVKTDERLEFTPINIYDEDILAMLHELDPSADIYYSVECTRKYYNVLIDGIYDMMKERILSFSKFEHVDFLELYNLKNTDLESEIIEKVAYVFCNHIMNMITDFKNSDLHNMYNGYKILYNKIIISDNGLSFLKENGNIPTYTEYNQACKIFIDFLNDIPKLKEYAKFVLK